MLVGEPPQTRLFGTKCPKEVGCVTAAVAAVPYLFACVPRRKTEIYFSLSSANLALYFFSVRILNKIEGIDKSTISNAVIAHVVL